ncbi:hypothetical protein [Aliivibrio fischeri]|uniref:hypothetical protein n=1 Tax=Aliivibrio fischeri TaxID=668 RepID=UPI00031382E1|nr:hypothetical protein [Aliivibrio fischeri]OEE28526.1 hypothetical protein A1Q3_13765 [Aliivibrio fischeri ZF-211]
MFTDNEKKILEKLDSEKNYLWADIDKIKDRLEEIIQSAPEHFKELKNASKDAAYYKNRAKEQYDASVESNSTISELKGQITDINSNLTDIFEDISEKQTQATEFLTCIEQANQDFDNAHNLAQDHLTNLSALADEKEKLDDRLENVNELFSEAEELTIKLRTLINSSEKERKEIQQKYFEVFGYKTEDELGNEEHFDGLVATLESSYDNVKEKLQELDNNADNMKLTLAAKITEYEATSIRKFDDYIFKVESQHKGVMKKIIDLLPTALTAGLSGAYENKIKLEEAQLEKHEKTFNIAIFSLVVCSLLPIGFNISRIIIDTPLKEIIEDTPLLLSMMIPLYTPILWVAYSANKKYKLSKRLIEEYTHKGVSSKTFEGLSKQIQDIEEESLNSELRTKLLFNLLSVNSENPGKLISDYNKSDHPLMDALEKSSKFSDALIKLERMPLISPLMKHLSAREEEKVKDKCDNVNELITNELKQKQS